MSELPVRWSEAAVASPSAGRRPEIAALPGGPLPDVATLFTFMRDAELRFRTLAMRIEERTWGAEGESLRTHEILIRHPDLSRVTVRYAERAMPRDHETWVCDGVRTRTWSAIHGVTTDRPVRRRLRGLESSSLPASSKVYVPVTRLPADSVVDVAIHPGTFLQNVLATGPVEVRGRTRIADREAIEIACLHPRTARVVADRPDHLVIVAADTELGVVSLLEERLGDRVVRRSEATSIDVDAEIPETAFAVAVPADARRVY
jgi:hypothetical protein